VRREHVLQRACISRQRTDRSLMDGNVPVFNDDQLLQIIVQAMDKAGDCSVGLTMWVANDFN